MNDQSNKEYDARQYTYGKETEKLCDDVAKIIEEHLYALSDKFSGRVIEDVCQRIRAGR